LKAGNVELAANYARRAIKIDPTNLPAARAYAGVLRRRGQLGEAISVLDKATIPDNDLATRTDLMALHMAKADASDSTEEFLKEADSAVELYKKVHSLRLAAAGTDPVARGDELVAAREWTAAVQSYQKCGPPDEAPVPCVNRQILALILGGRIRDADAVVRTVVRNKRADVNTQALIGLIALTDHNFKKARDTVQEGVENRNVASLIVAAYADLAAKQPKRAQEEAELARSIAPDNADVQLLRAYAEPDDAVARTAFVRSLELNPLLAEAYAQRGFHVLLQRDKDRFQAADALFDAAAKIDPKTAYVQVGKAVSFIAQRRPNEAEPLLDALLEQDKNAPELHVAVALNNSLLDKTLKITDHLNTALKLDPERWADVYVLKPNDLVSRIYKYRYPPVVLPASLSK
jgi:tetratricopeptide (TPR) repeat protein